MWQEQTPWSQHAAVWTEEDAAYNMQGFMCMQEPIAQTKAPVNLWALAEKQELPKGSTYKSKIKGKKK